MLEWESGANILRVLRPRGARSIPFVVLFVRDKRRTGAHPEGIEQLTALSCGGLLHAMVKV